MALEGKVEMILLEGIWKLQYRQDTQTRGPSGVYKYRKVVEMEVRFGIEINWWDSQNQETEIKPKSGLAR